LPNLPLFIAFGAAILAVFVTRFSWFGRLAGLGGAPLGAFQLALVVRAAVLLACLVVWVLRDQRDADRWPAVSGNSIEQDSADVLR